MGKLLIIIGVIFVIVGLLLTYKPFGFLGKLPGDISVERENFKFYFPIMTSIVLSIIVSLIIYLINRWKN